ncbi:MAG: hypothetical protein K0S37_4256, partial [Microbacterium sp.]|nr:hypothetical protein [Microbacterium sp.]
RIGDYYGLEVEEPDQRGVKWPQLPRWLRHPR